MQTFFFFLQSNVQRFTRNIYSKFAEHASTPRYALLAATVTPFGEEIHERGAFLKCKTKTEVTQPVNSTASKGRRGPYSSPEPFEAHIVSHSEIQTLLCLTGWHFLSDIFCLATHSFTVMWVILPREDRACEMV